MVTSLSIPPSVARRTARLRPAAVRTLPSALLARLRHRLPSASLDVSEAFDFSGLAADAPNWLAELTERNDADDAFASPAGSPAPRAASGPRFGRAALETGVRLHYAEAGDPGGEPVLFLHGYSDSWTSFAPVLPHLPSSFRLLLPSQRGHGDSDRPAAGYAMGDFAADAVAFLDALGIERATVVGHSMGSFIAQEVALAHPERVTRLVLVGSATTATEVALGMRGDVQALADPVSEAFVRAFQLSTIHRPLPEAFVDAVVAESRKLPARVWQDVLTAMTTDAAANRLRAVRTPTLILWGDRDAIFGRREQDWLLELIPDATLKVYPETGHALHWERPARFAEDLVAFVRAPAPETPQASAV